MFFEHVSSTPPDSSSEDQMLKTSDVVFKLSPLRELNGTNFMFSVWAKATASTNITISGGTESVTEEIGTSWKRITTQLLKNASEASADVTISVPEVINNGYIYFYKAKLESGTRSTDWTPAPEDIEGRVSTTESDIVQLASEIELRVTSSEFEAQVELLDNKITSTVEDVEADLKSVIEQTAGDIMLYVSDVQDDANAAMDAASSAQESADSASRSIAETQQVIQVKTDGLYLYPGIRAQDGNIEVDTSGYHQRFTNMSQRIQRADSLRPDFATSPTVLILGNQAMFRSADGGTGWRLATADDFGALGV